MTDFKQRVAARFDAAAASYDAHSAVQRHAAARLAGLIATASLPPRPRVLEIGCGTGHLTERLVHHLPAAQILATDIAPAMVAACRQRLSGRPNLRHAVMDGCRPASPTGIPFGHAEFFDLVCANLAAQWFDDLPGVLAALSRRLAPGGLLALSLLGAETFCEWRAAHAQLGLRPGTPPLRSAAEYAAAFPPGQLQATREIWLDRQESGLAFLRSLRAIGADTPAPGHAPLSTANLRRVLHTLGPEPTISYELLYACWQAT